MTLVPRNLSAALVIVVMACPAQAAEIRPVRGSILINSGTGYRAIEGTARLKPGHAAIAAPQALGKLTYEDGCTVDVVPGMIAWIGPRSPCAGSEDPDASRDPPPTLKPRVVFDPAWLTEGAANIDGRIPPVGP